MTKPDLSKHDPIRAEDVDVLLAEVNRLRQVEEKARELAEFVCMLHRKKAAVFRGTLDISEDVRQIEKKARELLKLGGK